MRRVKTLDIPLLEAPANLTRQDQVYRSLRQAVIDGRLRLGEQVPSTRELAARWSLSRGTVEQAYERLTIEGYLERRQGAGTFVTAALPEHFMLPDTPCRVARAVAPAAIGKPIPAPETQGRLNCAPGPAREAFIARAADPQLLDLAKWRQHLTRATREIAVDDMHLMQFGGLCRLRQAVADYVRGVRGIECQADDVVITTGIRQALSLVAGLLPQGATVALEDPTYRQAREIFESRGLTLRPTAVDSEGLQVEALGDTPCAAVYVTPAHQSPLGYTMSASRRVALLDWARRHGALVIEDDYDSEYNYLKSPPPALKSSDRDDRVLFCGSFNKLLYASLRIGFMIVPQSWRPALIQRLYAAGAYPGLIEQQALASMIESGDLYAHIRQARRIYQRRRDVVVQELGRWIERPRLSGEHCGFHFVLWLPSGLDDQAIADELCTQGIQVRPLSSLALLRRYPPALQLAFASVPDDTLRQATERLGALLQAHIAARAERRARMPA
ncbi:MAG: PLP-dependent aminotransferase family protein [Paludibacterium sp.]|uniref:MocR-like pyridoxine biosynthesis transcription factor PdxR n=1 Tax=Paludibacterium sp. TaxID=1917523 RepID=UPI0025D9B3A9|nr:PLP-dependent aminotransferase family protein [Paludibacterium sp.]MBV8048493.1 PLP-dependent aminotransferase family protein [Paludibacterium sp.]MBV8647353.1 PLP-dependent aminotransferase family protein [Paludibacterium sp.]